MHKCPSLQPTITVIPVEAEVPPPTVPAMEDIGYPIPWPPPPISTSSVSPSDLFISRAHSVVSSNYHHADWLTPPSSFSMDSSWRDYLSTSAHSGVEPVGRWPEPLEFAHYVHWKGPLGRRLKNHSIDSCLAALGDVQQKERHQYQSRRMVRGPTSMDPYLEPLPNQLSRWAFQEQLDVAPPESRSMVSLWVSNYILVVSLLIYCLGLLFDRGSALRPRSRLSSLSFL